MLHPAATASTGLVHHVGGVHPGQTILVGGAGNVGSAVVQVAHAMGAEVIASAHGTEDQAWCRQWGAKEVFDYQDPDLEAQVHRAVPNGVDIVWDTSGHDDLELAVKILRPGGCLVLMAAPGHPPVFPVRSFYTKNARAVGFALSNATVTQLAECARAINQLLSAGGLAARIGKVLPLAEAAEAQRLVEEGQSHGRRIVLVPALQRG